MGLRSPVKTGSCSLALTGQVHPFFLEVSPEHTSRCSTVPSLQTGALRLAVGWRIVGSCIKTLLLPLHR